MADIANAVGLSRQRVHQILQAQNESQEAQDGKGTLGAVGTRPAD